MIVKEKRKDCDTFCLHHEYTQRLAGWLAGWCGLFMWKNVKYKGNGYMMDETICKLCFFYEKKKKKRKNRGK